MTHFKCRLNRPPHVDKRTGEIIRPYEHDSPRGMIHIDVKKLGNIPDGGGRRYVGRNQGDRTRAPTPVRSGSRSHPVIGNAYVHTVIDDHSRVAYAEIHGEETAATAVGALGLCSVLVRCPRRHRRADPHRERLSL